ncbi:Astra associated protein 1 Asa1 [Sporothrix epigloea]|uniref:ASTRA-associated protein 1 n=1 Tax=Sporothrix epigloea TaxID=1892477 RepID=A0ABP0DA49_9PEZI
MSARPPAQPAAILRGHGAQVQAAVFMRLDQDAASGASMTTDTRLATGDSEGYVALWDLVILRPRAVWRAHTSSILGMAAWDDARQLVTHGRDHRLVVWQVGVADEARMSTVLPLDDELARSASTKGPASTLSRPQPWMVHVLEVNTMNFCAFAWTNLGKIPTAAATDTTDIPAITTNATLDTDAPRERLLAVPNTLTLEAIDLYHLPSQRRINTIRAGTKEGMVMAVALFYAPLPAAPETLVLAAGFENGVVVLATLCHGADGPATILYRAQPHSQPVLSLDVAPDRSYFLTSAADAVLAKHPICVTAAPQGRQRTTTLAPSSRDATHSPSTSANTLSPGKPVSLLSAALAREAAAPPSSASARGPKQVPVEAPVEVATHPLATVNTKHAGQQGLRIRDDGRIFATAGWDARVRVYSAQTMKEVAVLKWHQTGCFAVVFAPVAKITTAPGAHDDKSSAVPATSVAVASGVVGVTSQISTSRNVSVKERRLRHAVTAHWLAAGSKDGKISLWDIF